MLGILSHHVARGLMKATCGKILLLELPPLSISATMVRSAFHQGAMIAPQWLDPQVYAYIQQHHLYRQHFALECLNYCWLMLICSRFVLGVKGCIWRVRGLC
jgi:hypothetical protein